MEKLSALRKPVLSGLCFLGMALTGCAQAAESDNGEAGLYIEVFETLMAEDPGLNDGAEYMALDFSELPETAGPMQPGENGDLDEPGGEAETVSEETAQAVIEYMGDEYGMDIMQADFEELKARGLFNEETLSLEGVLLEIQDLRYTGAEEAVVEARKYTSGLGAIGLEITLVKEGDSWETADVRMLWIS
ncbi:hypothetical protein [Indiicoccus explosivorum]|uniref:hypothetical protein n=1 Tax=Indiicoccus explosivorum TaxID=1917864 RepID=UPI000B444F0F|nr:hypothetical protein [Indiicoccus explosivorum]